MGSYILSAVDLRQETSRRVAGALASAFFFEILKRAPDLSNGGLRLPYAEDGLYQFEPPLTSPACREGTRGDSTDGCLTSIAARHEAARELG